jgi:hypothetical protein
VGLRGFALAKLAAHFRSVSIACATPPGPSFRRALDLATRRSLRKRLRAQRAGAAAEPGAAKQLRALGSPTVRERATEWRRRVAIAQQLAGDAAARERARRAEEQARARHERLMQLVAREAAAWDEVESLIQSRSPRDYDRAVALLTDLRGAAAIVKETRGFTAGPRRLRAAHIEAKPRPAPGGRGIALNWPSASRRTSNAPVVQYEPNDNRDNPTCGSKNRSSGPRVLAMGRHSGKMNHRRRPHTRPR